MLSKHRKLKPTAAERLIWGEGDGSTLTTLDTEYGTMGSLICWENCLDRSQSRSWAEKLFKRSETHQNIAITVWGM